ncbi:uncharacterized protein LOC113403799 isoform X2 [Vanessa tameamea]|uniref:Uncharacterized protein LOC113403799 isoform X2 n=1 Tax=Vanessa tameamea TaxID=334116 RepID=A0A8B8IWV9_VANTA|nr:uncharacterized protein LOC113403799 isoform X2 [Vanessa tameamea]XP_047537775.1 uncharacterized protein LOC125071529 isoform X2 [Vanessa atalanta]
MKKTSSLVWRFFDRLEENKRCVAVLCKLCDTQYKYFGNTTNLRTHLVNKHPIQWDLVQNGTLEESTFRAFDDDDNTTQSTITPKRKKYVKSFKDENVDVLENSETDNEIHHDGNEEPINIVRQMHGSRNSDEEWLNDELYETIETYEPKRKRMKYRTIKREVQTPPPSVPKYVVRNTNSYKKPERIIIDGGQRKDEYSVFGEYVANKLRKLKNNQARGNVQQLITTILWQSEYGLYDSMDTVKRVLLHSVQEMEVVHTSVEQIIVQEDHEVVSPNKDGAN